LEPIVRGGDHQRERAARQIFDDELNKCDFGITSRGAVRSGRLHRKLKVVVARRSGLGTGIEGFSIS
jgi:hypothetical protein